MSQAEISGLGFAEPRLERSNTVKTMLFVDDHPIYRDGLQRALSDALPDLKVLTASGAGAALELLKATRNVDFCLADFRLTDGDGASLLEEIRRRHPEVAIGLLCADPPDGMVDRIKAAGGVACLSKARDTDSLAAAIEAIFDGGLVFDDNSQHRPVRFRSAAARSCSLPPRGIRTSRSARCSTFPKAP
jgi:DNA-binding NarL/FixJ family response regulator